MQSSKLLEIMSHKITFFGFRYFLHLSIFEVLHQSKFYAPQFTHALTQSHPFAFSSGIIRANFVFSRSRIHVQGVIVIMTIHAASKHFYQLLIAIGFISLLASCGGGGSSGPKKDSTPNAFTFAPVTNAAVSTEVTSAPVTINGINQSVSISVSGGSYSIGGGAFTSATVTVTNGQVVIVKVKSSDKTNTPVTATLTVGGVSAAFTVTTVLDVTPDAFTFTPVTGAGAKAVTPSNEITVTGVDVAVPVSITNGEYSVNGGAYTNAAGTVNKDQKITVRATSSDTPSTDVTAVLTIGGVTGNFVVTTKADNAAPTAQILFPPPVSMTEGNTILVRGSASDEFSAIASVKVNGVAVTPKAAGDFSSWTVSVPLTATSDNDVVVTTEDSVGNKSTNAAKVMVRRAPSSAPFPNANNRWLNLRNLVIDTNQGRNRLLLTSSTESTIGSMLISIDLNTGERSVVTTFYEYYANIIINPVNFHLYAFENDLPPSGVLEIDLSEPTKTYPFSIDIADSIESVTFNSIDNSFAVVNWDGPVIITDLTFTKTKVLENTDSHPDYFGLAFDVVRNRYLKTNARQQAVFAIDAVTGSRTIFSSNDVGGGDPFRPEGTTNSTPGTGFIGKPLIDPVNQRLFVSEIGRESAAKLFSIDLVSGKRAVISETSSENPYNSLLGNSSLVLAPNNNYIFWADDQDKRVTAIDVVTGERVIFNQ